MDLRQAKAVSALARLREAEILTPAHWPGHPEMPVKIRSLTSTQVLECRAAAFAELERQRLPVNTFTLDALEEELLTQIIFRVVRNPEEPKQPFALSVDDLRDNSTPDERAAMFRVYEEHRAKVDPDPDRMEPDSLEALVDAIKKKGPMVLRQLGRATLERLLLTTVGQLSSSPTGKSPSGSES